MALRTWYHAHHAREGTVRPPATLTMVMTVPRSASGWARWPWCASMQLRHAPHCGYSPPPRRDVMPTDLMTDAIPADFSHCDLQLWGGMDNAGSLRRG